GWSTHRRVRKQAPGQRVGARLREVLKRAGVVHSPTSEEAGTRPKGRRPVTRGAEARGGGAPRVPSSDNIPPSWEACVIPNPDDKVVDLGLLDRVIKRDSAAIAELYDRHSRLLYGLILRILRD